MKINYAAWQINPQNFHKQQTITDQISFLVGFAILAPSSHNSQPWKFKIENNSLYVLAEPERKLPVADPNERLMHIAMGCAIENICIAAHYYGLKPEVAYFPEDGPGAAARFVFHASDSPPSHDEHHLIFSIPKRRTNRSAYADRLPPEPLLKHFNNFSGDDIRIDIVTDKTHKDKIADILIAFREKLFSNAAFRKELAGYKRNNFTNSGLGMPGFTMGLNNIVSLVAPFIIRYFNVMRFIKQNELRLLKEETPAFVIISTKNNTKRDWLNAGRLFERMILEAEQEGVQTAVSAIPTGTDALQRAVGTPYFPQIFFRIGYSNNRPGHSPRLLYQKVITK